jgi:hypothetical protein
MPGIGEVIEGAMQQAPHPERQSMTNTLTGKLKALIVTAETAV